MARHREPVSSTDPARQAGLAGWFYRAGDTFAQLIALAGFCIIVGPTVVVFLVILGFAAFLAGEFYFCGGPCF